MLLSLIPITLVGYISFTKAKQFLEQSIINHLVATNETRKAEFEHWVRDKVIEIEMLASTPFFKAQVPGIILSHNSSKEHAVHHQSILEHLLPLTKKNMFTVMSILRAKDGLAMISTQQRQEGKFLDYQPYFKRGIRNTFVQNVFYDISTQSADMVISTPLTNQNGDVAAVLAAHMNLFDLSQIVEKYNKVFESENTYLVNKFNFFVTEPRFGNGFALKKTIHTKGVEAGLQHKSGIDFYLDYRNIPVIGVYSWMKERELCMISEIDQAEAYAPVFLLRNIIMLIAVIVVVIVIFLGWFIASTITRPLSSLVEATEEIGSDNLDLKIDVMGKGEFLKLEKSFNRMLKRLKESLVSKNKLEAQVEERIQAEILLGETMVKLTRSNQDLQQFAYVASHDLQEPLRMVASYTQLLSDRYGDKLDDRAKKYIFYAVDGATRMQQLIQDLLSLSRINTHASDFEQIDLNESVKIVLKQLEIKIKKTNAKIQVGDLPVIKGDPTQIGQLFQNLITNAIKFCKDTPPEISISAKREKNQWCLSVADNGIGIEEKYKEKIFIIFQRLHTRREYRGTGIGLAICKRIVERHGGDIWFESKPGEGSVFNFLLPSLIKENKDDTSS